MALIASHQHAIAHETSGFSSSVLIFQSSQLLYHAQHAQTKQQRDTHFKIRTRFTDLFKRKGVSNATHYASPLRAAIAATLCSLLLYETCSDIDKAWVTNKSQTNWQKSRGILKKFIHYNNASSKYYSPPNPSKRHRQSVSMVASGKETLERASKQLLSLVRKVVTMALTDRHHLIALTANQHRVREKNHHIFSAILPRLLWIENHLSFKTRDRPRIPFLFDGVKHQAHHQNAACSHG